MKLRLEIELSEKTFDALYKREMNFRTKINAVPGVSSRCSLASADILRAIKSDLIASAEYRAQELAGFITGGSNE